MRSLAAIVVLVFLFLHVGSAVATPSNECVIFLHGLARTSSSMGKVARAFADKGFAVVNVNYPSRKHPIEELAPLAVEKGLVLCPADSVVHFVTHSLGGILVRQYLASEPISRLGRVVMLAPPNNGSEAVDGLRHLPGFKAITGPAGLQLGTDEKSVPMKLGRVDYEVGIIAGTESFNPLLSSYLPNPDDGRVSVESTKVDGMSDFVLLARTHTFIMRAPAAIEQALAFIESGRFDHDLPD